MDAADSGESKTLKSTSGKVLRFPNFRDANLRRTTPSSRASTISELSEYIGPKYAMLLYLLGFKTIDELAAAHPIRIMSIPGIGSKRIEAIANVLSNKGLLEPHWTAIRSKRRIDVHHRQLSLDFDHSSKQVSVFGRQWLTIESISRE